MSSRRHKALVFSSLLLVFTGCTNQPAQSVVPPPGQNAPDSHSIHANSEDAISNEAVKADKDAARLNAAMDIIFKLPEVQAIDKLIQTSTQGKRGVSIMLQDEMNQDSNYYNLMVGNNAHEDRFENIFNFLVNKKTQEIKVYEPVTDSTMSLEDWRKMKNAN